ncbi:MAG: GNAT family N-acetyltransferase [Acidobacteria bacterium]|nr:MAG: GNAT family N-acetyltransferase [Acidobacteriota bacterium]
MPEPAGRAAAANCEVEPIADRGRFDACAAEWEALRRAVGAADPFASHSWVSIFWKHFGPEGRTAVLLLRAAGEPALGLPLVVPPGAARLARARLWRSLTNHHSYRFTPLVDPKRAGEAGEALFRWLRHRGDAAVLELVPGDARSLRPWLEGWQAAGGRFRLWKAVPSPYVRIEGDWEAYEAGLRTKFRANLRRRRRNLEKREGEVAVETVTGGERLAGALGDALEIEAAGWKGRRGSAIRCRPELASFYAEWCARAAELGWLRLSFLTAGGRRIAFNLNLEVEGREYCLKIGYAPEMARYSPGQLLWQELLRDAFRRGLSEFDFLGDVTPAKQEWRPALRDVYWVYLYLPTAAGRLHEAVKFGAVPRLKRWTARWRSRAT